MIRRGGSFKSFFRGVNNFLRKTHILSSVGSMIPVMRPAAAVAGLAGYGRRRRLRRRKPHGCRCGGGLSLAGSGLKLAGQGRRRRYR